MKKILLLLIFVLQACGQVGPLYHPGEKAPIYVPPSDTSEEDY